MLKAARKNAPSGLTIHSAGAGGIIVAFIDAFNGLDGSLLIAAGAVVVIILLFVYRSPILWAFPIVAPCWRSGRRRSSSTGWPRTGRSP